MENLNNTTIKSFAQAFSLKNKTIITPGPKETETK